MKAKAFLVSLLLLVGCGRETDSRTEDIENPLDSKESAESLPSIDFQIMKIAEINLNRPCVSYDIEV